MSFREMAAKREEEAAQLEEDEVWINVISKFVVLDLPLETKVEMMLSAIGEDKELALKTLDVCLDREIAPKDKIREVIDFLES